MLDLQAQWSLLPAPDELLIERTETREGHHLFFYPVEGRLVQFVLRNPHSFVHVQGRDDKGEPQVFTVMKIKGPEVILDGNHPLAGKALKFSLSVTDVRAATDEEIAHRHVHGAHGHHH